MVMDIPISYMTYVRMSIFTCTTFIHYIKPVIKQFCMLIAIVAYVSIYIYV